MDTTTEEYRRICEARSWLKRGYTDRKAVDALAAKIASSRGSEAAEQLRQDMRQQWKDRRAWMDPDSARS